MSKILSISAAELVEKLKSGEVSFTGKVPEEQSIENAQNAAKLCIINLLD